MNVPATSSRTDLSSPQLPDIVHRILRDPRFDGEAAPHIGPKTSAQVRQSINALDEYLLPAPRNWTLARIATLVAHYWTPKMPTDLQEAVARDWADTLKECPAWAIGRACVIWRDSEETKRPTPAAILKLTREQFETEERRRRKLKRVVGQVPRETTAARKGPRTLEEIAEIETLCENFRRNVMSEAANA